MVDIRYVGFTGHRDCKTREASLDQIRDTFPGAIWIHGGAQGFDTQVEEYAQKNGIKTIVIRPDYKKYMSWQAPLIRNEKIVIRSDILVACYDGIRKTGGTEYTISYARSIDKVIWYVPAYKIPYKITR